MAFLQDSQTMQYHWKPHIMIRWVLQFINSLTRKFSYEIYNHNYHGGNSWLDLILSYCMLRYTSNAFPSLLPATVVQARHNKSYHAPQLWNLTKQGCRLVTAIFVSVALGQTTAPQEGSLRWYQYHLLYLTCALQISSDRVPSCPLKNAYITDFCLERQMLYSKWVPIERFLKLRNARTSEKLSATKQKATTPHRCPSPEVKGLELNQGKTIATSPSQQVDNWFYTANGLIGQKNDRIEADKI